jgi:hypothetical protein
MTALLGTANIAPSLGGSAEIVPVMHERTGASSPASRGSATLASLGAVAASSPVGPPASVGSVSARIILLFPPHAEQMTSGSKTRPKSPIDVTPAILPQKKERPFLGVVDIDKCDLLYRSQT